MMIHSLSLTASAFALCTIFAIHAHAEDTNTREGRINFGGFLTDGNTDKRAVVLDGIGKIQRDQNRYTVGAEIRYAEDEGNETENEHSAYAEYDRFLNDQLFVGARANYRSDSIADLDYRIKVGPYVGYQFHQSDPLNLSTRAGIDYIGEKYDNGDKEDHIGLTWGLDYDQRVFNNAAQVFYKHEVSLPLDQADAFIYEGETGVRVPVAKILTGSAQIDYDWNNAPAPGIKEGDVTYSLKLGYEF